MNEKLTAYPLAWPPGWNRATQKQPARFHATSRQYSSGGGSWTTKRPLSIADGVQRVRLELSRMDVADDDIVISTNLELRLDGLPRSNQREPDDSGAAVYWVTADKERRCMAIDQYDRVADNLAAIAGTLSALRAVERYGGATILDRAFTGFQALPAPAQVERDIERELELEVGTLNEETIRSLIQKHHPDRGGDRAKFDAAMRLRGKYRENADA